LARWLHQSKYPAESLKEYRMHLSTSPSRNARPFVQRGLARLGCALGAFALLAVLGQPVPRVELPSLRSAPAHAMGLVSTLPPSVVRLASDLVEDAVCSSTDGDASSPTERAVQAEATARSALRMRWLLTSPSAGRGCGSVGCAG